MTSRAMHLVFYSDAAVFGGHEKMTVEIIREISVRPGVRVTVVASDRNARLVEALRGLGTRIAFQAIPYYSKATGWLRLPFESLQARRISSLLRDLCPTHFIIFAGSIDSCLKGIYAAKLAGFPIIMYLPQAHKASFLGSKLGKSRDAIQDFFYRRVDFWITISRSMAGILSGHGVPPSAIRVVYNGIDVSTLPQRDRSDSRAMLGFPEDVYIIANVGRIDFYVKNQSLILSAMARNRGRFEGCQIVFVGDGPDEESLRESISESGLEGLARILPWQSDMSHVYSAIDMLAIASRIEGVPLVMLEAMHYGLPIVSSDVDGMKEVLPVEWLFRSGDADAFAARVEEVRAADTRAQRSALRALLHKEFNLDRMGDAFMEALGDAPTCGKA